MRLSRFIIYENCIQHDTVGLNEATLIDEIQALCEEDISLFNSSKFFVALKGTKIIGSVKVTRWNENIILPIQKLFAINPSNIKIINKIDHIWHIGRFAISKTEKEGAILLKKLIALAIYPICQDANSIMLAECDKRFVRGLNLLGIKTESLGPGIRYLGSHTIPIYSKRDWLQLFLEKNTYIDEIINIYKSDPYNPLYQRKNNMGISTI